MIEMFVLIGWIGGGYSGGTVNHEFYTLEACENAKAMYIEMNKVPEREGRYWDDSWLECVLK